MAKFDPDAYLSGNDDFDPDSYLASSIVNELDKPSLAERAAGLLSDPTMAGIGGTIGSVGGIISSLPEYFAGNEQEAINELQGFESEVARYTQPKTKEGEWMLGQIAQAAEAVGDVLNYPASYLSGFADLATSLDPESAADTIKRVQTNGFWNTSLDKVEEWTGSPYMREVIARSPDLLLTAYPAAKYGSKRVALAKQKKRELIKRIESSDTSKDLAGLTVKQKPLQQVSEELGLPKYGPLTEPQQTKLIEAAAKTKRIDTFKNAPEAIRQGFDEGVVRAIATASKADLQQLRRMLDLRKDIIKDPVKYKNARPSDILGESVMNRVSFLRNKLKQAGADVETQAKALKGKPLEFGESVDKFLNGLTEAGVTFDENMRPIFKGSDFAGSRGSMRLISNTLQRMAEDSGKLDAYDIHRFKRMLNEWEFTGKRAEGGLTRSAERLVSNLRKDLNNNLRTTYPDYGAANERYSRIRQPLDEFIGAAKIKVDLDSDIADAAIGQEMRKLLTNYKDRLPLEKSLNAMDDIAKAEGGKFADNIYLQTHFINEMDDIIGDVAKRSFKAEQQKATIGPLSAREMAADKAAELWDKVNGINKVNAVKAIDKYLEEISNAKIY